MLPFNSFVTIFSELQPLQVKFLTELLIVSLSTEIQVYELNIFQQSTEF